MGLSHWKMFGSNLSNVCYCQGVLICAIFLCIEEVLENIKDGGRGKLKSVTRSQKRKPTGFLSINELLLVVADHELCPLWSFLTNIFLTSWFYKLSQVALGHLTSKHFIFLSSYYIFIPLFFFVMTERWFAGFVWIQIHHRFFFTQKWPFMSGINFFPTCQ